MDREMSESLSFFYSSLFSLTLSMQIW
jgi:hypothetical protein